LPTNDGDRDQNDLADTVSLWDAVMLAAADLRGRHPAG